MQANRGQAAQDFAVIPPPIYAMVFLLVVGIVLPLAGLGVALWFSPDTEGDMSRAWPVLLILPLILIASLGAMRRRSVALIGGALDVRAAIFRERTPIADIDLARARVVDLTERTDLRPLIKTRGMSLPGFHAGRFRLRGKLAKAFCLVTDPSRVLWLPLHDGKDQLLLSVERPQALLDAMNAVMDVNSRRA